MPGKRRAECRWRRWTEMDHDSRMDGDGKDRSALCRSTRPGSMSPSRPMASRQHAPHMSVSNNKTLPLGAPSFASLRQWGKMELGLAIAVVSLPHGESLYPFHHGMARGSENWDVEMEEVGTSLSLTYAAAPPASRRHLPTASQSLTTWKTQTARGQALNKTDPPPRSPSRSGHP